MGYEGQDFSDIAAGVSPAFVETLYATLQAVARQRRAGLARLLRGARRLRAGPELGQRRAGRSTTTDDLTAALDPTQMEPAPKPAKGGKPRPRPPPRRQRGRRSSSAAGDSIRAMMLIRTYRVRGHLAANLDPLGLSQARAARRSDAPNITASPTPTSTGRSISAARWGCEWATIRELVDILRANYCGNVGLEYMHIADVEERRFLQERMEGKDKAIEFTAEGKKAILEQGDRGRAVGEIPRQQICRHQALRARRRRSDDPRARKRHQIWRRSWACARSCSAWRIAAG